MKTETHIVPEVVAPARLQEYGVGIFHSCPTKSALKKAIKKGAVKVDNKPASTATHITGGEAILLSLPENVVQKKKLNFPLQVLFEDAHLAVIHKPAGIVVSGNSFKTVANALPQNLKLSELPDATLPQPVHRLDLATTGLLMIGKTNSSIRLLNKMFEDKKVKKTYLAVTIQEMESCGMITAPVDTKSSLTEYSVLHTELSERFGRLNLVELRPQTGRRHQLRKHLSGMGNPILGDKEYGIEDLILNGKGLYLHAHSLDFTHPFTGEQMHFEDELPKKFKKIFPGSSDSSFERSEF